MNIALVVGARPNFVKIAPIFAELRQFPGFSPSLIHTGQHHGAEMSESFFAALEIPEPEENLDVHGGTVTTQTAEVMLRLEPLFASKRPDLVIVVGDVNSTLATALVAVRFGIPIAHVEAGLRSFDRTMPEEINRVLTDQVSDLLFTTEDDARANLLREGISETRVRFVGNVMIDTLKSQLGRAVPIRQTLARYGTAQGIGEDVDKYAGLTLHRQSNVDTIDTLKRLVVTIAEISERIPIIFPIHPRTRERLEAFRLMRLIQSSRVALLPPLGYHEMLGLMLTAKFVMTDSGGVQEETTALGVPCVTLRSNTERSITVSEGTNTVSGTDPSRIKAVVEDVLTTGGKAGRIPKLWDGKAAHRISGILHDWFSVAQRRQVA